MKFRRILNYAPLRTVFREQQRISHMTNVNGMFSKGRNFSNIRRQKRNRRVSVTYAVRLEPISHCENDRYVNMSLNRVTITAYLILSDSNSATLRIYQTICRVLQFELLLLILSLFCSGEV